MVLLAFVRKLDEPMFVLLRRLEICGVEPLPLAPVAPPIIPSRELMFKPVPANSELNSLMADCISDDSNELSELIREDPPSAVNDLDSMEFSNAIRGFVVELDVVDPPPSNSFNNAAEAEPEVVDVPPTEGIMLSAVGLMSKPSLVVLPPPPVICWRLISA